MSNKFLVLLLLLCVSGCSTAQTQNNIPSANQAVNQTETVAKIKNTAKVIHVLVALCDNEIQGIVPVPAHFGNGEETEKKSLLGCDVWRKNLFWKISKLDKNINIGKSKRKRFRTNYLQT